MRHALALGFASLAFASCNCGDNLKSAGSDIEVMPLSIDFGSLGAGSAASRVVTVSSIGTHALALTRVAIENDPRGAFSVAAAPAMLAPGTSLKLSVTYQAPLIEGPDGASLVIESDSPGNPEVRVSLAGRSVGLGVVDAGDDAGTDAGADSGVDAGVDAGGDSGVDSGTPDSGELDAGNDAGFDAGAADSGTPDSGFDGGLKPDGGEVILTFDDVPNNAFLPASYGGVTWDSDWYVFNTIVPDYEAHSGSQYITNDLQASPISFSFPSPVYFEGAWFSLDPTRNATVSFDVYDSTGNHLGTSASLLQQLTPTFLPVNIANVSKVSVNFDVDFAMDDVTYIP